MAALLQVTRQQRKVIGVVGGIALADSVEEVIDLEPDQIEPAPRM